MTASVRQSMHWKIVTIFLVGDVLVTALLVNGGGPDMAPLYCAALGGLVAQPMLLGFWLGLARGPAVDRLAMTLGAAAAGATCFSIGLFSGVGAFPAGVFGLFVVAALGATSLAGGLFRAHRFLLGVLTAPLGNAQAQSAPAVAEADEARLLPANSRDAGPSQAERSEALRTARELQFGVGYIVAMTSLIAILIAAVRWIGSTIPGLQWAIVLGFGVTFLVYSTLAAFLIMPSILGERRRNLLAMAAVLYTLLAPPVALRIVSIWGMRAVRLEHVVNVYVYAIALALALGLVAQALHRQGYRLRHGWF